MKIYADEFIQAIEVIEGRVAKRIAMLCSELNMDSMIECRNPSIGDSVRFEKGRDTFVGIVDNYRLNVSTEIHLHKKSVDEISKAICDKLEKHIKVLIERTIENSEVVFGNLSDVRKCVKVVLEQDVVIEFNTLDLLFNFKCFVLGDKR